MADGAGGAGRGRAEVIRVATAFEPKVTPGQYVQVAELDASALVDG